MEAKASVHRFMIIVGFLSLFFSLEADDMNPGLVLSLFSSCCFLLLLNSPKSLCPRSYIPRSSAKASDFSHLFRTRSGLLQPTPSFLSQHPSLPDLPASGRPLPTPMTSPSSSSKRTPSSSCPSSTSTDPKRSMGKMPRRSDRVDG